MIFFSVIFSKEDLYLNVCTNNIVYDKFKIDFSYLHLEDVYSKSKNDMLVLKL